MNIETAVQDCYLKAVGKASAPSTSKRNKIVGLLNYYQRRFAREPGIDWSSLYDPAFSLGNITATDTFDLDTSTIRKLSDREGDTVRIVWSNGTSYTDYDIVAHDKLKDYSHGVNKESPLGSYVTQIGSQLVFNHTFTSANSEFGGELFVPVYTFTDEITYDNPTTDEVQVDDPDWLVTRAAAEYVRTDITRQSQYSNLLSEANEIMQRMKDDNEAQITTLDRPWTAPGGLGNNGWD
jgi:hypothetical protein